MGLNEVLELEQYSPQDWGATKDYDSWNEYRDTSQVFIHWGGTKVRDSANDGNINSEKATLRDWESYHVNSKGWRGIAYDWAVGQSGTLYRLRGTAYSAATSGDVDHDGLSNNREGEAVVCLIGEGQSPSEDMLQTLKVVLDAMDYAEVFAHREVSATACPGDDLFNWVVAYRNGELDAEPEDATTDETTDEPALESKKTFTEDIVSELAVIKKGDRSVAVKRCQALLNLTKMHSLATDGIFGPKTERAVFEYQEHFRLMVDGIVGPQTWKHLLTAKNV